MLCRTEGMLLGGLTLNACRELFCTCSLVTGARALNQERRDTNHLSTYSAGSKDTAHKDLLQGGSIVCHCLCWDSDLWVLVSMFLIHELPSCAAMKHVRLLYFYKYISGLTMKPMKPHTSIPSTSRWFEPISVCLLSYTMWTCIFN